MKKRYTLPELSARLAAVATGKEPAQTVIKNAILINVNTKELIEHTDVAIYGGRIAFVGDAAHTIGEGTRVIDANGKYIAPGFMDGHMHLESSMLTVTEYAAAVLPRGTSAIFMDPHEIANVLGLKGIDILLDDAKNTPLNVFSTMPSCVPAFDGLEDNGCILTAQDVAREIASDKFCALGEMMNYPGVINGESDVHKKLKATIDSGKIITGHFPVINDAIGMNAYFATGPRCCHETTSKDDALQKLRLGVYLQIREGSAWHDLHELCKAVTENNIDTRFCTLVTDDSHAQTLLDKGHLDYLLKRAVEEGIDPIKAVQMVSINVAECFRINLDYGSISPGKYADINIVDNLVDFKVLSVINNGELIAQDGKMCEEFALCNKNQAYDNSVKLKKPLAAEDFEIKHKGDKEKVAVNVIGCIEASVITKHLVVELAVVDKKILADPSQNIAKAAVIERHNKTGLVGLGFVKGLSISNGAIASTISHDAHNIEVIGTNDEDMAAAANIIAQIGGGMVVVSNGKLLAKVSLPLAGLISAKSAKEVASEVSQLLVEWEKIGSKMVSPFMTMALMSLAAIPELRLTNRGLLDAVNIKFISLIVE